MEFSIPGTLAYGLTHISNAAISDWRILFLVEGAPAVLFAPFVYYFLPNRASTATFLTDKEKRMSLARGVADGTSGHETGLNFREVWKGLQDPKAWIHALSKSTTCRALFCAFADRTPDPTTVYFSCNVSYSSLPVFLPTILTEMGFSS